MNRPTPEGVTTHEPAEGNVLVQTCDPRMVHKVIIGQPDGKVGRRYLTTYYSNRRPGEMESLDRHARNRPFPMDKRQLTTPTELRRAELSESLLGGHGIPGSNHEVDGAGSDAAI